MKSLFLTPSARRALSHARYNLKEGEGALFFGAGFDKLISKQSDGANTRALGWTELLEKLMGMDDQKGRRKDLTLLEKWPTEMAMMAKIRCGKKEFLAKLSDLTNGKEDKVGHNCYSGTLEVIAELIGKVDLVITTNYSNHIGTFLRSIENQREIIVLERNDLIGFSEFLKNRERKNNNGRLYLVYLHGKAGVLDSPILDAWGYNVIQTEDQVYKNFLRLVLAERCTVFIGTSWTDIPLREAAAFVHRTMPFRRPGHILLDYRENGGSISYYDTWTSAMQACYGVKPISVNEHDQEKCIDLLRNDVDIPDLAFKNADGNYWEKVADFLDECGDFESHIQHKFLLKHFQPGDCTRREIRNLLTGIAEQLTSHLENNKIDWDVAARIESHLRHHLYLYCPREDKIRRSLWESLATKLDKVVKRISNVESRVITGFLIGCYEVAERDLSGPTQKLLKFINEKDRNRVEYAKQIWGERRGTEPDYDFVKKLLDEGWEALAAKVSIDILKNKVREYTDSSMDKVNCIEAQERILLLAEDGMALARAAGMQRRAVAAEVISIMWSADLGKARANVISKLRSLTDPERTIEYPLIDGFAAALLVNFVRDRNVLGAGVGDEAAEFIEIVKSSGINWRYMDIENIKNYWIKKYWINDYKVECLLGSLKNLDDAPLCE